VKITALGEENRRLQETILSMAREKKEIDLINVEKTHRAAKVGQVKTCDSCYKWYLALSLDKWVLVVVFMTVTTTSTRRR